MMCTGIASIKLFHKDGVGPFSAFIFLFFFVFFFVSFPFLMVSFREARYRRRERRKRRREARASKEMEGEERKGIRAGGGYRY